MHPFTLERPRDLATALAFGAQAGRNDATAEYIAGGTDMVQLLQEYVRRPDRLVSLNGLLDNRIEWCNIPAVRGVFCWVIRLLCPFRGQGREVHDYRDRQALG